jgi:hypothetical protein
VKALLDRNIALIFCGYPTLVAFGASLDSFYQLTWFERWLQVSKPAVEVLRPLLPVFNCGDLRLTTNGVSYDMLAAQHLYAYCYLVGFPILIFLCIAVWRSSRHEWLRVVRVVPQYVLYGVLIGAILLLPFSTFWVMWDAPNGWFCDPVFLFVIGPVFAGIIMFILSGAIALGAIIEGDRLRAERRATRNQRMQSLD